MYCLQTTLLAKNLEEAIHMELIRSKTAINFHPLEIPQRMLARSWQASKYQVIILTTSQKENSEKHGICQWLCRIL
jgi:hypothetical protein